MEIKKEITVVLSHEEAKALSSLLGCTSRSEWLDSGVSVEDVDILYSMWDSLYKEVSLR